VWYTSLPAFADIVMTVKDDNWCRFWLGRLYIHMYVYIYVYIYIYIYIWENIFLVL